MDVEQLEKVLPQLVSGPPGTGTGAGKRGGWPTPIGSERPLPTASGLLGVSTLTVAALSGESWPLAADMTEAADPQRLQLPANHPSSPDHSFCLLLTARTQHMEGRVADRIRASAHPTSRGS